MRGGDVATLTLDGNVVQRDPETPLAERIVHLLQDLDQEARVVHQVMVDGRPLQGGITELVELLPANQWQQIDLHSVSVHRLLLETMEGAIAQMDGLLRDVTTAAHSFQTGQDEKAFTLLAAITENLQAYIGLLDALGKQAILPLQATNQAITGLSQSIQQLMTAWRIDDYVLVSDILLYEIAPQLEDGQTQLVNLALDLRQQA